MPIPDSRLDFDQSPEENRATFIEHLMQAGWTRNESEAEYDRIQEETEGDY